jgi:hypothetical protein
VVRALGLDRLQAGGHDCSAGVRRVGIDHRQGVVAIVGDDHATRIENRRGIAGTEPPSSV